MFYGHLFQAIFYCQDIPSKPAPIFFGDTYSTAYTSFPFIIRKNVGLPINIILVFLVK